MNNKRLLIEPASSVNMIFTQKAPIYVSPDNTLVEVLSHTIKKGTLKEGDVVHLKMHFGGVQGYWSTATKQIIAKLNGLNFNAQNLALNPASTNGYFQTVSFMVLANKKLQTGIFSNQSFPVRTVDLDVSTEDIVISLEASKASGGFGLMFASIMIEKGA